MSLLHSASLLAAVFSLTAIAGEGAKVLEVPSQTHLVIEGRQAPPWIVGEPVCILREWEELGCGTIIYARTDRAEVQLETQYETIEVGDWVQPLPKERRAAWKKSRGDGAAASTSVHAVQRFQLSADLLAVPTYIEPSLTGEVRVSTHWTLGVRAAYFDASLRTAQVQGTGVQGVITGYMRKQFEGVFIQVAVGNHFLSGAIPKSSTFFAASQLGLRVHVSRSVRAGFGIALRYLKNPVAISNEPELRPALTATFAVGF